MDGKKVGLLLGAFVFIFMIIVPAPEGLEPKAWRVAAVTVLMAIWWITEAIPIPATALLPIVMYPALGILTSGQTTASYGDQVIYLFMGGFFLAVTMERWNLHKRIALYIIRAVGSSPSMMIMGFMAATALLSMWISNTACAVMMVPIGIAVVTQITGLSKQEIHEGVPGGDLAKKQQSNFAKALMLSVAYSASLGGVATIIGTPPNTIMVGMIDRMYGFKISFAQWMMVGVPLSLIMLFIVWFLLTKVLFKMGDLKLAGSKELIAEEIEKLGAMTRPEKMILLVGCLMAFSWIFRVPITKAFPMLKSVTDTTIAIGGASLLFILPVDWKKNIHLLDWQTAVKIPWDIVILFGGGITIANAFDKTGLATWISGGLISLEGMSMIAFVLIVTTLVVFLTEITSNTATATLMVPIMGAAAIAMGIHPYATIISACVAASFAFMLPVATPPNAVIFGSGYIRIKDMAYAGLLLNFAGIVVIAVIITYIMPMLWGIDLGVTPEINIPVEAK